MIRVRYLEPWLRKSPWWTRQPPINIRGILNMPPPTLFLLSSGEGLPWAGLGASFYACPSLMVLPGTPSHLILPTGRSEACLGRPPPPDGQKNETLPSLVVRCRVVGDNPVSNLLIRNETNCTVRLGCCNWRNVLPDVDNYTTFIIIVI